MPARIDGILSWVTYTRRPGVETRTRPEIIFSLPAPYLRYDAQRALLAVLQHAEVLDEPLVLEQLGDPHLELGGRDVHLLVLGVAGVADAGEQVGDRIGHRMAYQLAFTMPGTSPLSASSRKHRRHIWNLRR